MFRPNSKFKEEWINCLMDNGGLGDNIANMVCVKYMVENFPWIKLYLYVPDYFIDLAKNLVPVRENLVIRGFKDKHKWNKHLAGLRMQHPQHTSFANNLVDTAFHLLANYEPTVEQKNYPILNLEKIKIDRFNLPEKYVVIQTGYTAPVREMIPEAINGVSKYVITKGYTPVFLGNKSTPAGSGHIIVGNFNNEIDYSKGIDLINKTSLLESGKILAGAEAVVGVDGGLIHLAACSDTKIIIGFTSVDPRHRTIIRHNIEDWGVYHVVPDEKQILCRFCQSNWVHMFDHDFRECYYQDKKCIYNLTSDKYIKLLEKLL